MLEYLIYPILRHGVLLLILAWAAIGFFYRDAILGGDARRVTQTSQPVEPAPRATPASAPPAEALKPASKQAETETAATVKPATTSPSTPRAGAGKPAASAPAFLRVLRPNEEASRPPAWKRVLPSARTTEAAPRPGAAASPRIEPRAMPTPAPITQPTATAPTSSVPAASPKTGGDSLRSATGSMTVMREKAAPESGGDEKAWLSRARKAYWEGDKQRAMGLYREGLKQYPESASMLGELGNIAFEAGRLDEALGYLRKAEHSLRAAGETRRAENLKTIIGMIEHKIAEKGAKVR